MPPKKAPKYPCGTCSKSATTNSLLCNFCDMWHHATVECIPWHSKETIGTLLDICKEQSCWTCQKCCVIMKKLNGRLAAIEKDVKEVKSDVEVMKTNQETTDGVVADLQSDVSEIRQSIKKKSSSVSDEVLAEMKDREDRKHNAVVIGIKESSSTDKEEVHAEENELLNQLFSNMGINPDTTAENIKFKTRLGTKEAGKKRPFLLKFHDVRVRDNVIRNSTRVTASGIRVKPDLTKKQREEDELFKQTIDEENKTKPSDDSGDFRWKLAGPPGNLRKVKERDIKKWEDAQKARAAMQER